MGLVDGYVRDTGLLYTKVCPNVPFFYAMDERSESVQATKLPLN
jgi:hypothetical protein